MSKQGYADPSFPDRLQRFMDDKNLTRADIARSIWGTFHDERGYEVAKNRQVIGRYLQGKAYPSAATRRKLTSAIGVRYSDLFPNDDPTNEPGSGITMTQVSQKESKLDISVIVPHKIAEEVIKLIRPFAS